MTDTEYEALKGKLQALAEKWIRPIGLAWWTITTVYERDPRDLDFAAQTKVDWPYLQATITFNMWNLSHADDQSDEALERIYVHELMHIFVNEMRSARANLDHEERVCTTLANAFIWLAKGENPIFLT